MHTKSSWILLSAYLQEQSFWQSLSIFKARTCWAIWLYTADHLLLRRNETKAEPGSQQLKYVNFLSSYSRIALVDSVVYGNNDSMIDIIYNRGMCDLHTRERDLVSPLLCSESITGNLGCSYAIAVHTPPLANNRVVPWISTCRIYLRDQTHSIGHAADRFIHKRPALRRVICPANANKNYYYYYSLAHSKSKQFSFA